MSNPIQYTSRDYDTIIQDINNDPYLVDRPEWFKRLMAGVGDLVSMWNNVVANQSYLQTAFTIQAVINLLQLIDYQLTPRVTSSGSCLFYLNPSIITPISFSASELIGLNQGNIAITSQQFESRTTQTINSILTGTFTSGGSNQLTVSNDFLYSGRKLRLTTTNTLPTGLQTSTDYYVIYVNSTTIKLALSISDAYSGTFITISGAGTGVHTWNQYDFIQTMYQQKSIASQSIGKSDGITSFQTFDLADQYIISSTLTVTVSGQPYTVVTTFVNSQSTDKVFKIITKANDYLSIQFGNGIYGAIPPSNDVMVTYGTGGGTSSNITTLNQINIYAGGNSNILGISNPVAFTGGADLQDIEIAKVEAPLLLKSTNRFVTAGDGETLAFNDGGLSLVQVNRNQYGPLTCQIVAIASGGGNPSPALRTAIQTDLISKSILSSIDVRFESATITAYNVTSGTNLRPGYLWTNVLPYLTIAWKLFFTETGKQINDTYNSSGINSAVTLINTIFGTTFLTSDAPAIQQIIEQYAIYGYRNFGDTIQISTAYAFIQGAVQGINYITVSSPSFPVICANNEITTASGAVFTLTQI